MIDMKFNIFAEMIVDATARFEADQIEEMHVDEVKRRHVTRLIVLINAMLNFSSELLDAGLPVHAKMVRESYSPLLTLAEDLLPKQPVYH